MSLTPSEQTRLMLLCRDGKPGWEPVAPLERRVGRALVRVGRVPPRLGAGAQPLATLSINRDT